MKKILAIIYSIITGSIIISAIDFIPKSVEAGTNLN
jgi:hypothetical protein